MNSVCVVEGLAVAEDKVAELLREVQQDPCFEHPFKVTLLQIGQGEMDPVHETVVSVDSDPLFASEEIVDRAAERARELGLGKTRFRVRADDIQKTCAFTLRLVQEDEDAFDAAEPKEMNKMAYTGEQARDAFAIFAAGGGLRDVVLRDPSRGCQADLPVLARLRPRVGRFAA